MATGSTDLAVAFQAEAYDRTMIKYKDGALPFGRGRRQLTLALPRDGRTR